MASNERLTEGLDPTLLNGYIPRKKMHEGAVLHPRHPYPITEADEATPAPGAVLAKAFALMTRGIHDIVKGSIDESKIVDEYQSQTLVPYATASLFLQPTYEYTERIESIVITGPTGAVNLQLGDRFWTINIPAAGIYVIAPVAIYLGRDDARGITAGIAGDYTLELMGHADTRWTT